MQTIPTLIYSMINYKCLLSSGETGESVSPPKIASSQPNNTLLLRNVIFSDHGTYMFSQQCVRKWQCVRHPNSTRYVTELSLPHPLPLKHCVWVNLRLFWVAVRLRTNHYLFPGKGGMEDSGESHGFQGGSGGGISARRQSLNRYLTANQLTKRGGGRGEGDHKNVTEPCRGSGAFYCDTTKHLGRPKR